MSLLKVARMGHPVLRRAADPVKPAELRSPGFQRFLDDLAETMREYDGVGLAAPQVHVSRRAVVIQVDSENPEVRVPLTFLVNPVVRAATRKTRGMWEGCLSLPGLRGYVSRPAAVRVEALDRRGRPLAFDATGFFATVIQHETDHLDGRLYVDRITDLTKFAYLEEFERYWLTADEAEEAPLAEEI
jgi:peptide deformylase